MAFDFTSSAKDEEKKRPIYEPATNRGGFDFSTIKEEPLQVTVTDEEPEEQTEYTDRVSTLLSDSNKIAEMEQKRKTYEETVGYDEFSQEMEALMPSEDKPEKGISSTELAESPKFLEMASNYLIKRIGKVQGDHRNYEDKQEFINRYLEHTRAVASNMASVAFELDAIRKMSEQEKKDVAKLYQLTPNLLGASESGKHLWEAVKDYAYYTVTDPSNVITLGSGAIVKAYASHKLSSMAMAQVLRSDTAAMVGTAGVEGVLGFMEASDRQSIDMEVGLREGRDFAEIGLQTVLQGAFGAAGVKAGTFLGATGKSTKEKLDAKLEAGMTDAAREELRKAAEERIRIIDEFDPVLGRRILDDLQGDEALAEGVVEPQIKRQVANDVYYAILKWADNNEYVRKELLKAKDDEGKRISDVVFTLVNSDKLDETGVLDALRDSLATANVTQEQFANAMRTSVSDAAKLMRDTRTFKERLQKMAKEDPDSAALISRITGTNDEVLGTGFWDMVKRADRETRALMVTGLGTTVRNAFSGVAYMGMQTAANIGDSIMYQAGLAGKTLMGKATDAEKQRLGLGEMMKDSLGLLYRFARQGESMELADRYLKGNDDLYERLFHDVGGVTTEVAGKEISAFAKTMNTLNRVQDSMFRRAVFTHQVDLYLRRAKLGTSSEFLRAGKPIPTEILKKATEDSLKATFAYMPKPGKSGGETLAYHLVKINENLPFVPVIGTADMPFMRFVTNAVAFQYKYSPLQGVGALKDAGTVVNQMIKGQDIDEKVLADMRTKIATTAVGSAMIGAAMAYRKDNQDVNWYEMKDEEGRPVDMRAMFPIAPYLMAGQFLNQLTGDTTSRVTFTDFLEGITGSAFKTGQLSQIDNLVKFAEEMLAGTSTASDTVEIDWQNETWLKFAESMGGWTAQQAGRVLTPTQILSDIVAAVDEEEAIVRDRNIIDTRDPAEMFFEATKQGLMYKTPIAQQNLPALKSPTREGDLTREGTSVRQFIGARIQTDRNPIETELTKFGISNTDLIPRSKVGGASDIYRELTPEYLELVVGTVMSSDRYKNESNAGKKELLKNAVNKVKGITSQLASAESLLRTHGELQTYDFVGRNMWLSLPSSKRSIALKAMEEYGIENPTKSKDPMAYTTAIKFANAYYKRFKL